MEDIRDDELFLDPDSDDELLSGFRDDHITKKGDIQIEYAEDDLRQMDKRLFAEPSDPTIQTYHDEWLQRFTEIIGPIGINDASPFAIFRKIFDDEVIDLLVKETNHYYYEYIDSVGGVDALPANSPERDFDKNNVTHSEMQVFLGLITFMGFLKLPTYDLYWSEDPLLGLDIVRIMHKERFLTILNFFHVSRNQSHSATDEPGCNSGYKVQTLANMLVKNWQRIYYPEREVAIGKCFFPFTIRERHLYDRYRIYGVKVWYLCESSTGYIYNWLLQTEKLPPDGTDRTRTHRTVMNMTECIHDKGHHVYMDSYCSSPALYRDLAQKQTGACGTLRTYRKGVPQRVKQCKPADQVAVTHREGDLLFVTWKNKRMLNLLTSVHNSSIYTKKGQVQVLFNRL